jgi:hypothetical protein
MISRSVQGSDATELSKVLNEGQHLGIHVCLISQAFPQHEAAPYNPCHNGPRGSHSSA